MRDAESCFWNAELWLKELRTKHDVEEVNREIGVQCSDPLCEDGSWGVLSSVAADRAKVEEAVVSSGVVNSNVRSWRKT